LFAIEETALRVEETVRIQKEEFRSQRRAEKETDARAARKATTAVANPKRGQFLPPALPSARVGRGEKKMACWRSKSYAAAMFGKNDQAVEKGMEKKGQRWAITAR